MTLDELIEQGKRLESSMVKRQGRFTAYIEHQDEGEYNNWVMLAKRYINTNFPEDKFIAEFDRLADEPTSRSQMQSMVAILAAMKEFPEVSKVHKESESSIINIQNNQSQSQTQNIFIEVFVEALHEELSKKQIRELKEIAEDEKRTNEEKKASIIDKIKDFGLDTLSGVIANVLSNPAVWAIM